MVVSILELVYIKNKMDAVTIFAVAGFGGAILSGFVGYLNRAEGTPFSKSKFAQDFIAGTIVGLSAVAAGMVAISPEGNSAASAIVGLLTGYGVNSVRVDAGLKK